LCAAYPTMKAALDRFVMALAKETRPYGIPVIALDPGATMNERFNLEIQQTGTRRPDLSIFRSMGVPRGGSRIPVMHVLRCNAATQASR
jgi:NAD(P)-dependent dehydrogenase (short-subunit alcohol dehydrogenase family)